MASRRDFIKKTSMAGAAIAIGGSTMGMSAKSYRNIIGSNERLNVAIAGLGRRLEAFKEPIALKESNVKLLYLCDVMESQRLKGLKAFREHIDYNPALENDIRKVLDDKKGIIPQIESTHEEVKVQVVRQGVNSTMSHFFSSNGPPTAQSTFEYPNLEVRVSWFLFVSIFTYREFFGCTSFFYLGVKSKRVLVPLVAYYTIKGTI